jgi:cation/acetate symporter
VLGWTGGYVLVAILLAPYLRKFGIFTVPDFLGTRYEGHLPRLLGIIVLFCASFTYIVAQIVGVGIITSRFLQIPFGVAVFVGLAGILVCSMLGGMRAVTWTQVAQYIILIIAYILPVAILSAQLYGVPIPQLTYGQALQRISELEQQLGVAKAHVAPFVNLDALNFFALIFCLMIGTASLPHILMRYFTTPTVRDARKSVAWSLFFIFLLYFTAPAYAAFAKLEIYQNVIGQAIADLPVWVANWGTVGLVTICDAADAGATIANCVRNNVPVNGNGDGILQLSEFVIHPDAIVLATPEIAGLPYVIAGLVAAGGLAAALSTADGLLLAIANALSHDVYYKMIDPKASTTRRLTVARVLLVAVAIVGAYSASFQPAVIVAMVAWAFSLAAAGLFVPLVLGIWWKRTTKAGACAGMIAGFLVCLVYLVGTQFFGMELWFGVRNISSAIFGLPIAFIVTIVVSLMTKAPSQEMQDMVDSVRIPRGEMPTLAARAVQH